MPFSAENADSHNMVQEELELHLLEEQLGRIELASVATLRQLGFPTTIDQLALIDWDSLPTLDHTQERQVQHQPADWKSLINWRLLPASRRAFVRACRRGLWATQALLHARQVRDFVQERNAARAAYAAMQAGVFGGDLLSHAERGARLHDSEREGGRERARNQQSALARRDADWLAEAEQLRKDNPHWGPTAVAAHIAHRAGRSPETVRKRLRKLDRSR